MDNSSKTVKAHFLAVLSYMKPFLFVLLLPLVKAIFGYLFNKAKINLILTETFAAALLFLYAFLKWLRFRIDIGGEHIEIHSGLFVWRKAVIEICKISTVETVRNPFDAVFGSATVRINTEAGRRGKAAYEIKLRQKDVDYLNELVSKPDKRVKYDFSPVRVALMAAATSSSFAGIVIAVPIIFRSGNLFGAALSKVLIERIEEVGSIFGQYAPPFVNTVTIIFLLCYIVAFVYSFFKFINFRLIASDKDMEICSGFFSRRSICFRLGNVNNVCIEQSFIMRLFARCLLRLDIGGYGSARGEKAVVVPSVKENHVKTQLNLLSPDIAASKNYICPHNTSRTRFLLVPFFWMVGLLAVSAVLCVLFSDFRELILFLTLPGFVILLYFCDLADWSFKNSKLSFSDVVYAKYTRRNRICHTYCDASRVGIITVTTFPMDKLCGSCNVRITVCSQGAETFIVKHIPYNELLQQIDIKYKIYE